MSRLMMRIYLGIAFARLRVCPTLPSCSRMPIWSTHREKLQSQSLLSVCDNALVLLSLRNQKARRFARPRAMREIGGVEGEVAGKAGVNSRGMLSKQSVAWRCWSDGEDGPNVNSGFENAEMELKGHATVQLMATLQTSKPLNLSEVSESSVRNHKRVENLRRVVESLCLTFLSALDYHAALVRRQETVDRPVRTACFIEAMSHLAPRKVEFGLAEEDSSVETTGIGRADEEARPRERRQRGKGKRERQTVNSGHRRGKSKLRNETPDPSKAAMEDEKYMMEALVEAKKAAIAGEVPVGAVIVRNNKVIARAYNRVESERDPTAHAEMLCIRSAARHHGNWRLVDATLYVTLEPCPMCAGAILQSRFKRLVWGTQNTLLGADGSWISLLPERAEAGTQGPSSELDDRSSAALCSHPFHTNLEVHRGVLANDCSTVMRTFFQLRRKDTALSSRTKPWWLSLSAWVLLKRLFPW